MADQHRYPQELRNRLRLPITTTCDIPMIPTPPQIQCQPQFSAPRSTTKHFSKGEKRSHDTTRKHSYSRDRLRAPPNIHTSGRLTISPEMCFDFTADDLQDLGEIGRGNFGTVNKMIHRLSQTVMAVKRIRSTVDEKEQKELLMDLEVVMKSNDCPYIVQFYGAIFKEGDCWICMEVMDTSLDKFYKFIYEKQNQRIPENILGKITVATVKALNYLKETLMIIHRDVKPSNILLDRRGNIKLCDFGISGQLVDSIARTRDAGCRPYMAPERIDPQKSKGYDVRSDVWSLGITLIELATGSFPYPRWNSVFEQLTQVVQGDPPRLSLNENGNSFTHEFVTFVNTCLIKDETSRPKYNKLLEHSFIQRSDNETVDVAGYVCGILDLMSNNGRGRFQIQFTQIIPTADVHVTLSNGEPTVTKNAAVNNTNEATIGNNKATSNEENSNEEAPTTKTNKGTPKKATATKKERLQKHTRSFFSTSVGGDNSPPKKNSVSPSVAASKDDEDSPVMRKSKQRKILHSDDDGKSGEESTDGELKDKFEKHVRDQESKSKRKMNDLNSDDSDSAILSKTPKKKIRTYSGRNKSRFQKLEKKAVSSSSSAEELDEEDDKEEEHEKVSKDETDRKSSTKGQASKSISSFFKPVTAQPVTAWVVSTKTIEKTASKDGVIKPETYDPASNNYHPIDDAPWKREEKVPYLALAKTLEAIEGVSSRLKMIDILTNFFRSVIVLTPDDLLQCTYLCINKLAPSYEGLELGIGESLLVKAISQSTGRSIDSIKSELADKGDLGIIAESSRSTQRIMFKPAKLTVRGVYEKLREIAQMSGNTSMTKKVEKIQVMLVACVLSEARYLIRSLGGKLRIGLAEQSLLAALAQAITMTPPGQDFPPEILDASKNVTADKFKKQLDENALVLKTTYCECPSYDAIISVLLKDGIKILPKKCKIKPGIPIKPMLAHPTKGIQEVLQRFEDAKFTCEYKYDGERAQIHVIDEDEVRVYSRNQENNTSKYPDIVARIPKVMKKGVKSCILDAEAVAWDVENKQILPFQILSTRKRKDTSESTIKVQVCVFAFDLLYLNGKSLVTESYEERRSLLHSSFDEIEGEFIFVTSMDTDNMEKVGVFLEEAIKNKCEGLMMKTLDVDASYEIAKRSHKWLKLKKDYLDGVGDTLDLVVIGGYFGKGKRAGAYGGYLLACYDPDNEEFQTICKLGTGFKDEDLAKHASFLKEHVLAKPKSYYRFDSTQEPDEWFEPVQVWEVKCADLSVSPVHKAAVGIVDPQRGISLRFPRFVRIRDDKRPEDATSSSQVVSMYRNQEQIKNHHKGSGASKEDDEDFY